jgi:tyrosinase
MSYPLVRRDIWALEDEQQWHPITDAYARGILVMQGRGPDEPTSWLYQAAIHGLVTVQPGDDFRDQCQHNSWYFLPWHRMYLYWFERMVRDALQEVPEVDEELKKTWTLPYWDYERTDQTATLPPAFREEQMPDGQPNPLHIPERDANINLGGPLPALSRSSAMALGLGVFTGAVQDGGFGGPVTGWQHEPFNPQRPGGVEARPHNGVHGQVGGAGGFMSNFDDAPKDPVFWMHHANIDRLWQVWLDREGGRENPAQPAWTGFEFDFHDDQGQPLKQAASAVLDTATQLEYTYERLTAGPEAPAPPSPPPPPTPEMPTDAQPDHPPELVGATEEQVQLQGPAKVTVNVARPESPALAEGGQGRVLLGIEGISGDVNPGLTYAVYVNLPDDDDADTDPESHLVGELSFFGIERVGDLRSEHPQGQQHTFDITAVANQLKERGKWDPGAVTVSFEPVRVQPPPGVEDAAPSAEERPAVSVGRVSVFVQ